MLTKGTDKIKIKEDKDKICRKLIDEKLQCNRGDLNEYIEHINLVESEEYKEARRTIRDIKITSLGEVIYFHSIIYYSGICDCIFNILAGAICIRYGERQFYSCSNLKSAGKEPAFAVWCGTCRVFCT